PRRESLPAIAVVAEDGRAVGARDLRGRVAGSVVHDEDLVGEGARVEERAQAFEGGGEPPLLVVGGDDDRQVDRHQLRRSAGVTRLPRSASSPRGTPTRPRSRAPAFTSSVK